MFEKFKHTMRMIGIRLTGRTMSIALTMTLVSLGVISGGSAFLFAVPIGVAIAGFIDHLDHRFDMDRMTMRYRDEIAARLNKNPAEITSKDLQRVADGSKENTLPSNPVLKEATDRIHAKHMVSFLTTVAAGGIAIGIGLMLPAMPFIALGLSVFSIALATNAWLNRGVTHALHLDDPTLNDRLSALEEKRGKVKEFEMFGLATEANPGLAAQIKKEFGTEYRLMSVRQKVDALDRFSETWNIPQITEEFNKEIIRPTELTFALAGQPSGVPKNAPPVPLKEKAEAVLQKGKDFGHSVWMHLKVKNAKTGKDEDKLVICRPQTGCVALDPETSENLLPLLEEQQRLNSGEQAKSFTGRHLQREAASEELQQRG